jgi:peptide/nickel transport system substrate-binding protein
MKRSILWISILILSMVFLSACQAALPATTGEQTVATSEESREGGWIKLAVIEDPDSLDPHKTIMATASSIQAWIYDELFYIGEDGLPKGLLAESWETNEDGTILTINLREGRNFHDGTPVDANAVAFTFNRLLDPETAAPAKGQVGPLETVTALDDYTVEFVFSAPYPPFFFAASTSYMGIISPQAVEEKGDGFGRDPVGSGPFMFKEWKTSQEITLVRNPDYINVREDRNNKGAPYIEGLVFKNIPEVGTRIAALETDEINVLGLSRESIPQFIDDPDYTVITAEDTASFNFVEFNYTRAPFDNPAFRRAFGIAIDKDAILKGAYTGYATINYNPYPTGNPGYDAAIGDELGMKYDPEAAAAMFDELGWRDEDGDGIREAHGIEGIEDGAPASWVCWTYPFDIKQRECEIIQANLSDIGVKIEIQLTDFGTMSAEMPKGNFDFDVMRWTWNEPVILSLLFKCPGWKQLFCDPDLDEILNAADTEMDPVKRLEYVKEAQRYILEQAIVIPFATDWYMTAARAEVNDLRYDATFGLTYDDVWLSNK